MHARMFGRIAIAVAVLCAETLLLFAQAANTPSRAPERGRGRAPEQWTSPRTADGRPDLQGVWDFSTATPLERPAELAGKEFFTDQEAEAFEKQVVASRSLDRRDGGAQADIGRAYNDFWADWGTKVVATKRTSLIVDPPDGRLPPLTPERRQREAARAETARRQPRGPEDRSLSERCMVGFNAGPPMITGPYNNYVQLIQSRNAVAILTEMIHTVRIVPSGTQPHVAASVHQWSGDARGRWEGDTLVVDTTNFRTEGTGNITLRISSDANLHLTERFTRIAPDILLYRFTVDDPTVWTRPWTAELTMKRTDASIYEYACHEGNYAMTGMLSAARADERKLENAPR